MNEHMGDAGGTVPLHRRAVRRAGSRPPAGPSHGQPVTDRPTDVFGPAAAGRTEPLAVSLADLIARAADGDTVTIPHGLTPGGGPVRIGKSVRLVCASGAEVPDDIVVHGPVTVALSGITGTGVITASPGARLIARDCQFSATQGRAAVIATGTGCVLELTGCRFTGAEATAVRLGRGATARLTDCDFASFQAPAVAVSDPGTSVEVSDCRFADMTGHAVLAEAGGAARVAGCSFDGFASGRWTAVIAVGAGSSVDVTGCRFGPMTAHGLFVRAGGRARVHDCDFLQSAGLAAVTAVDDRSHLDVTRCRFTALTGRGVEINDGAAAVITDCDLQAVGELAPVYAEGPGSAASLIGCRVSSVNAVAVAAAGAAELQVRDVDFDCPGATGLADGTIGMGRDGSRLRITGACSLRGATVTVTGTLDHRVAAAGAAVELATALRTPCPHCNGSGGRPGADLTTCARCGGRGTQSQPSPGGDGTSPQPPAGKPAPTRRGLSGLPGQRLEHRGPVHRVRRKRRAHRDRTLQIDVPAGVATGHTLIVAGQGGRGLGSAAPGDLHIVLTVLDPPFRTVEDYFQKALGVRVAAGDHPQALGGAAGPARPGGPQNTPPDTARRELDEAVRREAIRLGLLPADAADDPP